MKPTLRYLRPPRPLFFPVEAEVPESKRHLELRTALFAILKHAFADRAQIGSEQFVYWDASDPAACLSPDVFLRLGAPDETFDSWKTWERGAPQLAVEIVSPSDASDTTWAQKLEKYSALGVTELVRFDPVAGSIRIWHAVERDLVERDLRAGEPVDCVPLELFWVVTRDDDGAVLRLARDPAGTELLLTREEAALERVKALEAELRRGRIGA